MKYELSSHYFNEEWKGFLLNIQDHFQNEHNSIHKARNELKIILFHQCKTVVKRFKTPHFIQKIAYTFFKKSKAKKSFEHALKLQKFTPSPIGYIEFFNNGLIDQTFYISEYFQYDFTIREVLLQQSFPNREKILKKFAAFTFELHENGIFHDDYSPGNILIQQSDNSYIFKIVDINRLHFTTLSKRERAKNFAKLWATKDDLITIGSYYIQIAHYDYDFIRMMVYFSQKNKLIKNMKKKLKGKSIDW